MLAITPPQVLRQLSGLADSALPPLTATDQARLERDWLVDQFDWCLHNDVPVSLRSWRSRVPPGPESTGLLRDLLEVELTYHAQRRQEALEQHGDVSAAGGDDWLDHYREEYPEFLAEIERFRQALPRTKATPTVPPVLTVRSTSYRPPDETSAEAVVDEEQARRAAAEHQLFRLAEQVRLDAFLDKGSSKWVFRGEQLGTGRPVAVKQFRDDDASRERQFRGEVRIQALIDHQNIPPVFLLNDSRAPGQSIFVEKLITGEKWSATLARPTESRDAKLRTLLTISRVLQYAHQEHGVIHRDLKPDNVLVNPQYREVYLTDWGSAALLAPRSERPTTGIELPVLDRAVRESVGTAAYMSPEQAQGDTAAMCCATDVFQLGAILYEIVTGEAPYTGPLSLRISQAARCAVPPLPVDVPAELKGILQRALAPRPADRYAQAGEFADAVERFLDHQFAAEQLQTAESRLTTLRAETPQTTTDRLALLANLQGLAQTFQTNGQAWNKSGIAAGAAATPGQSAAPGTETAVSGWQQARLGEYQTRVLLEEWALRSGDFDQAELQLQQLRDLETNIPPIGELRASTLARDLQRARQRRRLTSWTAGLALAASLLLGVLTGWFRIRSLEAEGRATQATADAALAKTQRLEAEAATREEQVQREFAQRELEATAELRDLAEGQRRTAFSRIARIQQLDPLATLGELEALTFLRGDFRTETLQRIQSATNRSLSVAEQSPRRIGSGKVGVARGGRLFLTADHESTALRAWDAETGELLAAMEGHLFLRNSKERGGNFSSITGLTTMGQLGDTAVTCGVDGQVIRWNLQTFTLERKNSLAKDLSPHWTALSLRTGQVPHLPVTPVVGDSQGNLVWFDPDTLEERRRVTQAHAAAVRAIVQSTEGTFATSAIDGSIRLWTSTGEAVANLRDPDQRQIRCLAFSPQGSRLLVGGEFASIELWDTSTRQLLQSWAGHASFEEQQITLSAIPLGDNQFLTGGGDGLVVRWNAADGKRLSEFPYLTAVGNKANRVRDVAWDPTRNQLVISLIDGTLVRAETETGRILAMTSGPWNRFPSVFIESDAQVAVARGGAALLTSSESPDGSLQLWQTEDLSRCRFLPSPQALRNTQENVWDAPTASALSPTADTLALGTPARENAPGELLVLNADGRLRWKQSVGGKPPPDARPNLVQLRQVEFDPTGQRLATLCTTGLVQIWSVADGTLQLTFETALSNGAPKDLVNSVFTGDRHLLFLSADLVATGGEQGARLWNAQTGELLRELGVRDNPITALAPGPTADTLLAGDTRGIIYQWELATGKELSRAVVAPASASFFRESRSQKAKWGSDPRLTRSILSVAATPDGKTWCAALGDATLAIVDHASGLILARAIIHEEQLSGNGQQGIWDCRVFFDPQQRLCTATSDRIIRRWRLGYPQPEAPVTRLDPPQRLLQLISSPQHGWGAIREGTQLVAAPGELLQAEWQHTLPQAADLFFQMDRLPDGRFVASRRNGAPVVWNPATGTVAEAPLQRTSPFDALIAAAEQTPLVATTINPQTIALWDVGENRVLENLTLPKFEKDWPGAQFRESSDHNFAALRFSPQGDLLAAATEVGEVIVWDLTSNPPRVLDMGYRMPMVQDLRFTRDGRRLFQTGAIGVLVWDPRNLNQGPVTEFNWHDRGLLVNRSSSMVHTIDCSPDGRWLVTTGTDGTVRIGTVDTEQDEYRFHGSIGLNDLVDLPNASPQAVSLASQLACLGQTEFQARFSHDGQQIAVLSDAQRLALLDTQQWLRSIDELDTEDLPKLRRWVGLELRPDFTLQRLERNSCRALPYPDSVPAR